MFFVLFFGGLIFPWIFYFFDMYGNNFDAHFSRETLERLRVKDNSFLRKIIPLKEGEISKKGKIVRYRYFLYPRALALFIQTILIIFMTIIYLINIWFISIIPEYVFEIIGGISIFIWLLYTIIINLSSQLLKL